MNRCRRTWFSAIVGSIAALLGCGRVAKGAAYYPYHNCPNCGQVVVEIYCWGPGQYHTHRHGNTYWYH